jgi:DNA gyrase subunit A
VRGGVAPDVRDGLTPVARRALMELGEQQARTPLHVTSARTLDAVLAKGRVDGGRRAIYGELVRMAGDWLMRHPLVDGNGFLGSIDGDDAASADYTELRLAPAGADVLRDARLPNLLVNGSFSAATAAASRIPPHNLREVADAAIALLDDPTLDCDALMRHIRGPDFPTGGVITGDGLLEAYASGRGTIVVRARTELEEGRGAIVVSELPFMVAKGGRDGVVGELRRGVRARKVRGVRDVEDQSSAAAGLRIVIELAHGAQPEEVLEELYAHSRLQRRVEIDLVAVVDGEARRLGLADLLARYVAHRRERVAAGIDARASSDRVLEIVRHDLLDVVERHGDARRTDVG